MDALSDQLGIKIPYKYIPEGIENNPFGSAISGKSWEKPGSSLFGSSASGNSSENTGSSLFGGA